MENKYLRKIVTDAEGRVDVYAVLAAFNVTNPALQHGIKKLLLPGVRHSKGVMQDLLEARQAVDRAIEMFEQTQHPLAQVSPLDEQTRRALEEAFGTKEVVSRPEPRPTLTGYRVDQQPATVAQRVEGQGVPGVSPLDYFVDPGSSAFATHYPELQSADMATSMAAGAAHAAQSAENAAQSASAARNAGGASAADEVNTQAAYARAAEANVCVHAGKPERWVLHSYHTGNGWVRAVYLYEYANDELCVLVEYPEAWHNTNLQPQPDEVPHLLVDHTLWTLQARMRDLPWRPRRQADYLVRTMESPSATRHKSLPGGVVWHPSTNDFYDTETLESKGPEFRRTWLSRLEAFPVATGGVDEPEEEEAEEEPTPPRPTLMLERKEADGLTYRIYQVTGPESSKPFKVYRSAVRKGFPKGWTPCTGDKLRKALSAHHSFESAELWVKNNGVKKSKSV